MLRAGVAGVLVVMVSAPVLAGCQDDSRQGSGGTSTRSAAPSSPAPGSDAPSTNPDFPGVVPAEGVDLERPPIRMRLPRSWVEEDGFIKAAAAGGDPLNSSSVVMGALDLGYGCTVQEAGRVALDGERPTVRRLPDVELDGRRMYHLAGQDGPHWSERFGRCVDTADVSLAFTIDGDVPRAERKQLIDSMLATVEWTDR